MFEIIATAINSTDPIIIAIAEKLGRGLTDVYEAAQDIAKQVQTNPEWEFEFKKAVPGITDAFFEQLLMVGRGTLHKRAFALPPCCAFKAIKTLPLDVQAKVCSEPVEVLLADGQTWLAPVTILTPLQTRQVFASDHVRPLNEQRAWMESEKTKQATLPRRANPPYRIVRDTLVCFEPCRIDVADILRAVPPKKLAQIIKASQI